MSDRALLLAGVASCLKDPFKTEVITDTEQYETPNPFSWTAAPTGADRATERAEPAGLRLPCRDVREIVYIAFTNSQFTSRSV